MIKNILASVLFCLTTELSYSQEFSCKIQGTVIGRDSKEVFITPVSEDFNNITILKKGLTIPIVDNKFEFELKYNSIEAYLIIFKEQLSESGFRRAAIFFPDTAELNIILYSDSLSKKNKITGGEINRIKNIFENKISSQVSNLDLKLDSLQKINKLYTEKFLELTNKIWNQAKDEQEKAQFIKERNLLKDSGGVYTPEAFQINKNRSTIYNNYRTEKLNYIKTHHNLYSYYCIYDMRDTEDSSIISTIKSIFPIYSRKYPVHPYTALLNAKFSAVIGGHFIDFSAPTFDGKLVTVSDSIKDKIALIDLWSTWCGPCRQLSKSIIPVYEKYKSRGFTVIGVCGVYKNMLDYKYAMDQDKYPWLNLIEFNNKNGIWAKYGFDGSGGRVILVDKTGKIIAISPNAKELDEILNRLLK